MCLSIVMLIIPSCLSNNAVNTDIIPETSEIKSVTDNEMNNYTKSEKPYIIQCTSGQDSITGDRFRLLCGEVTGGGYINITGDNITTINQYTGRTRFFIPIYMKNDKDCMIQITFTGDDNGIESDAVNYKLKKMGRSVDFANFTIGSSKNFVHWPDWVNYACNNYMSDSGLLNIYRTLDQRNNTIKKAAGNDTNFIILLAPDPLVMYDETASDSLKKMRSSAIAEYNRRSGNNINANSKIYTAMNQIADYVNSQSPDFSLIDMTPILKELKKEESFPRLYHTTDNHWSSLGAFYGYREIMNVIYSDTGNEGTKPLTLDDFEIVDYELSFTSMAGFADPWSAGICEIVDMLIPKKERTSKLVSGEILNDGRFWSDVRYPMEFIKEDDSLPTAVILRDSFATALYPMLNEHFSHVWYGDTWNYVVDYNWLSTINPDYVIIIAVERLSLSALQQR